MRGTGIQITSLRKALKQLGLNNELSTIIATNPEYLCHSSLVNFFLIIPNSTGIQLAKYLIKMKRREKPDKEVFNMGKYFLYRSDLFEILGQKEISSLDFKRITHVCGSLWTKPLAFIGEVMKFNPHAWPDKFTELLNHNVECGKLTHPVKAIMNLAAKENFAKEWA